MTSVLSKISIFQFALILAFAPAHARTPKATLTDALVTWATEKNAVPVAAAGSLEVAFSPREGAEVLVIKVIDSARSDLRILAYDFTSAPITAALLRARKRGVEVHLVADQRSNAGTSAGAKKAQAAFGALALAGADVRLIAVYPIHHDKAIVADQETVETGSFNFSSSAETRNSENVLVNWKNPALAAAYLAHFERNAQQAKPYVSEAMK